MDMARPPPPLIQLFIISDFYYKYYSDSDLEQSVKQHLNLNADVIDISPNLIGRMMMLTNNQQI